MKQFIMTNGIKKWIKLLDNAAVEHEKSLDLLVDNCEISEAPI